MVGGDQGMCHNTALRSERRLFAAPKKRDERKLTKALFDQISNYVFTTI